MMRQFFVVLALLAVLVCGIEVRAEMIACDNFDYPTGEIQDQNGGSGNWIDAWDLMYHANPETGHLGNEPNSEIVTPATALSYNAGVGAATLGGGNALWLSRQVTTMPSGSPPATPVARGFSGLDASEPFYLRYLIRLDSSGTWDANDFFLGWGDTVKGDAFGGHGDGPNLGLAGSQAGANDFFARVMMKAEPSIPFAELSTYLIVGRWEDTDLDGKYDTSYIWVNPDVSDSASTADASAGPSDGYRAGAIAYLGWRFGVNLEPADIFLVDDVAITTTFEEAIGIPEPTVATALWSVVLAFMGLGLFRHKQQQGI